MGGVNCEKFYGLTAGLFLSAIYSIQLLMSNLNRSTAEIFNLNVISLCVVLLYLHASLKFDYKNFLSSIPHVYYFFGLIASLLVYREPIFLFELSIEAYGASEPTFASILLIFTLEIVRFGFSIKVAKISEIKFVRAWSPVFLALVVVFVVLISFYIYFAYGSAHSLLISRSAYWVDVIPSSLLFMRSLIIYSFFLVALILVCDLSHTVRLGLFAKFTLFVIFLFITVFVLGDKFSGLVMFITAIAIVYAGWSSKKPNLLKIYFYFIGVAAVLILGVSYVYSFSNLVAGDSVGSILRWRIAAQSQLLWSTLQEDLSMILMGDPNFSVLNYSQINDYLSKIYQPHDLHVSKTEGPGSLTGYFPSNLIISVGLLWLVPLHAVVCLTFGILQRNLLDQIGSKNFWVAFFLYTAIVSLTLFWYAGKFEHIYRFLFLIFLIISFYFLTFFTTSKRSKVCSPVNAF